MSTHDLKPGDRVRLRVDCPDRGCRAGERGKLARRPRPTPDGGPCYYHVLMDKDGVAGTPTPFAEDEIEPDL